MDISILANQEVAYKLIWRGSGNLLNWATNFNYWVSQCHAILNCEICLPEVIAELTALWIAWFSQGHSVHKAYVDTEAFGAWGSKDGTYQ